MPFTVIYTRVSTEEQAKTGLSLKNQEKACRSFAERSGYDVLEVFCEEGASAKSTDRKELLRMLNFCKENKNKVDAVIVWKVDRFARRAEDHLTLRMYLTKLGITLLSATEAIEDTTTGRLMETILAGVAQFDNEVRAERSTSGLRARLEQGGWVTYAPLGYENTKDALGRPTLKPLEPIAKLVRKLFEQYSSGSYTLEQITDYAFNIGLRSRQSNGRLAMQTISNLLHNPAYIGRRRDKQSGEQVKMLHPPLIPDGLFNEVQLVLQGKHKPYRQIRDANWPLRGGFARCSEASHFLTGSSPAGRNKYYAKYSCPHCRSSHTGMPVSVDRQKMHDQFKELLLNIRPKESHLKLFRRIVLLRWNDEYKELTGEKARIEEDLKRLQSRRERVLDLFIDEKLSETEKESQLQKIDSERAVLRVRRGETEREVDDREQVIDIAIDFMQNVARYWEAAPLELQRRFQYLVFPDGIAYDFAIGFRTAKLGETYEVINKIASKNSSMVGDTWSNWNQLCTYLIEVYNVRQDVGKLTQVTS